MKYLIVVSLFILVGCKQEGEKKVSNSISSHAMVCEAVSDQLQRCENREAICYISRYKSYAPFCFYKK